MSVAKEKDLHFIENFGLSGAAAIISKTAAAPIERVKLLVQNQDEMMKAGRLDTPYKGVIDCTKRTYQAEGIVSFWRGKSITLLDAHWMQLVKTRNLIFLKTKQGFLFKQESHQSLKYHHCDAFFDFVCLTKTCKLCSNNTGGDNSNKRRLSNTRS